jgi:hypothetical protein
MLCSYVPLTGEIVWLRKQIGHDQSVALRPLFSPTVALMVMAPVSKKFAIEVRLPRTSDGHFDDSFQMKLPEAMPALLVDVP